MACEQWMKLLAAYKGGEVVQANKDAAEAQKDVVKELQGRAEIERQNAALPDAALDKRLQRWTTNDTSGKK